MNGEEPQIRPGLHSHNFLILLALDPNAQATSLCSSPPRTLVDPLSILTPPPPQKKPNPQAEQPGIPQSE